MRNDARPIGEHASGRSPIADHERRKDDDGADSRESVAHDRQSHVVNRGAEDPGANGTRDDKGDDRDPVMGRNQSALNTRI